MVTALLFYLSMGAAPNAARAPATISVAASASAAQGTITQVDFYANGAWIGVDTLAPYTVSWSGVGTGTMR